MPWITPTNWSTNDEVSANTMNAVPQFSDDQLRDAQKVAANLLKKKLALDEIDEQISVRLLRGELVFESAVTERHRLIQEYNEGKPPDQQITALGIRD